MWRPSCNSSISYGISQKPEQHAKHHFTRPGTEEIPCGNVARTLNLGDPQQAAVAEPRVRYLNHTDVDEEKRDFSRTTKGIRSRGNWHANLF